MLKITIFILSLTAILAAIWIIIPAPAYNVWLFSVAASEWSLWIGVISLIAIAVSSFVLLSESGGKLWIASLLFSIIALVISVYPFLSVRQLAQRENVSLSFGEYFSRFKNADNSEKEFTTKTFTKIDGKNLEFDVYLPTAKNINNGASIVVIHGGSWNAGERNDFPNWNKWLAANGFTVFDIDYRLAPQPNYLTANGDVKCAVLQIKKRSQEFNISPERIALLGRSAGGHLALLAAYSAENENLPPSCSISEQSEKVRAVVSFYAPTDLLWAFDNTANEFVIDGKEKLSNFLGGSPHESKEIRERYILASPTTHISNGSPPTLLIHGGRDQLVRSENMQFADEKLNRNKILHETIFIPYAQHGFDYNFHGWGSQITKEIMLDFLGENTKPIY